MDGVVWLDAVMAVIQERSVEGEVSRPDDDTLAVSIGARGIVLHVVGNDAFLVPSLASGSTIASRLHERVTHFDAERFVVEPGTVGTAVSFALRHLEG